MRKLNKSKDGTGKTKSCLYISNKTIDKINSLINQFKKIDTIVKPPHQVVSEAIDIYYDKIFGTIK